MNEAGFIFSHRKKWNHWTTEDPKWFMAWDEILHAAFYVESEVKLSATKTRVMLRGEVNISQLESRQFFTDKEWRVFVNRLIAEEMVSEVESIQLGGKQGAARILLVLNYDKYQSENRGRPKGRPTADQKADPMAEQNDDADATVEDEGQNKGRPKGAPEGRSKGSHIIINTLQEVKEEDMSSKNHEDATELVKIDESPPAVEVVKAHPYGEFYQAWNDNCGDLPKSKGNKQADKLIKALLKEVSLPVLAVRIAKGACVVRHEAWWQQNRYGLVNLLRNLDSKVEIYDSGQGFTGQSASFESEFKRIMGALA